MLTVKKLFPLSPQSYGSAYSCSIGDTVVEQGSMEFLVFQSVLSRAAARCGFVPIVDYTFANQIETNEELFKHFTPHFSADSDPNLTLASSLFCTFAFTKPHLGFICKKRKAMPSVDVTTPSL
jgi:hypothetical protein